MTEVQLDLFGNSSVQSHETSAVLVRSHLRRVKSAVAVGDRSNNAPCKPVYVDEPATLSPSSPSPSPVPHNGTATSKAAAGVVEASGTGQSQKARILACLESHHQTGLTRAELSARLGISINAVCGRVAQLRAEGQAVETGETRKGESGVLQAVLYAGNQVGDVLCFRCYECPYETAKKADTKESRQFYITGRGYLTVRTCRECGHREVA